MGELTRFPLISSAKFRARDRFRRVLRTDFDFTSDSDSGELESGSADSVLELRPAGPGRPARLGEANTAKFTVGS